MIKILPAFSNPTVINTIASLKIESQSKRMLSKVKSISSYKRKHDSLQHLFMVEHPCPFCTQNCVMVGMNPRRELPLPPTDTIFFNSPPSDNTMVSSSGVFTSLGSVAVEEAAAESMVMLAAKVESADAWCRYNKEREERSDEFVG